MKNKKKGLLHLLVIIAIIGLCSYTTLVGFTDSHKGSAQNIKLGLDLAGGVSITYQTVKDNPTETEMKDTISMMQDQLAIVMQMSRQESRSSAGPDHVTLPALITWLIKSRSRD